MFRKVQSLLDPYGSDSFFLSDSVGWDGANNRDDVARVEKMLGRSGHLNLAKTDGPTGYYGLRLKEAVEAFQKEHGLKQDGHLNPDGETIATPENRIGGIVEQQKKARRRPASSQPSPGKGLKSTPTKNRLWRAGWRKSAVRIRRR